MEPSPAVPDAVIGRRERKKRATRDAIAAAAERLFVARGFDAVTVAEIADAADVALSTVFAHFDGKEAIAFARDPGIEAGLVDAVRGRRTGGSIVDALRTFLADSPELVAGSPEFVAMVRATPALTEYSDRMWSRHALALAAATGAELGLDPSDIRLRAWTRYVVQIPSLVREEPDRAAAIDEILELLGPPPAAST